MRALVFSAVKLYTDTMKQVRNFCIYVLIFTFILPIFALSPASLADFRDAMYSDPLNHSFLLGEYEKTKADIQNSLQDYDLYVALARCDYYMGRSYGYAKIKTEAAKYYDSALEHVQKALHIRKDGAEALLLQGENISQNCAVKPTSYAMSNGLKVGKIAKQVVAADKKNGAALYLLYAQYIYAPGAFRNLERGIKEMKAVLADPDVYLEKDDVFNINSAIGYAYVHQEKYDEALPWIEKALEVYPTNFFVLTLKNQIQNHT
ncbi:tetratricopeptide repeat protein [Treponema lecithinolyticum ATCC 700332]|uniref:Tetratricopeptide repeat protein n=3 Tax=Treponema lecithinolyticum TaxID=53418 RepID=A0ABN0P148_TRELE|nr:tetratricopeptide repeat protein [Treponema lecithinolyticum ATCC 700332]